jgi:hypothetical protein
MRVRKNTKRVESKSLSPFARASKNSIKKDFNRPKTYNKEEIKPEHNQPPQENSERRVHQITEHSEYYRYHRLLVGRLVKILEHSDIGSRSYYVSFVFDEDRKALNKAAGWSDAKDKYLLDGVIFK